MLSSQNLRRLTIAALAATAALTAVAPGARAATTPATPGDLYVATTDGGTLTPTSAKDTYRLTLTQPNRTVTAFADRPARTASDEALSTFVKQWSKNGFKADPPNAALVVDGAKANRDVMVVELSNPKLARDGALTLTAKRISKPDGALAPYAKRADNRVAAKFGHASLFVDASTTPTYQVAITINGPAGTYAMLNFDQTASVDITTGGPSTWRTSSPAETLTNHDSLLVTGGNAPITATYAGAIDVSGNVLSGKAQLPTGVTATVQVGTNAPVTIANGAFSVPL